MPQPIGIGASRGAAILGLSEWASPYQVWKEIQAIENPAMLIERGIPLPERKESAIMAFGHAAEDSICQMAEITHGACRIVDREKIYAHAKFPFVTCHIDGKYAFDDGAEGVLHEGKTTNVFHFREKFGEPGTDAIPVEYQVQCQHQMACTGAKRVIVSVLCIPFFC